MAQRRLYLGQRGVDAGSLGRALDLPLTTRSVRWPPLRLAKTGSLAPAAVDGMRAVRVAQPVRRYSLGVAVQGQERPADDSRPEPTPGTRSAWAQWRGGDMWRARQKGQ